MGKGVAGFMIFCLAVLFLPATVFGADVLRVEQMDATMPMVSVVYHAPGEGQPSARLNGEPLELISNKPYTGPTSYYFLVDVSTSLRPGQLEGVKKTLLDFTCAPADDITLITFGEEVQVFTHKTKDKQVFAETVANLSAGERGTIFSEALHCADELSKDDVRRVALLFTDGVDVNLGGYTQTVDNFPIYILGFNTCTKGNLEILSSISRESGGRMEVVSQRNVGLVFAELVREVNQCSIGTFRAKSNAIDNSPKSFEFALDGQKVTKMLHITKYTPDTTAPNILSAVLEANGQVNVIFSKPITVLADKPLNVVDEEGNALLVENLHIVDNRLTITFAEPLQPGTFTITCPGVSDISMEKNRVESSVVFTVSELVEMYENALPAASGATQGLFNQTISLTWLWMAFLGGMIAVTLKIKEIQKLKVFQIKK